MRYLLLLTIALLTIAPPAHAEPEVIGPVDMRTGGEPLPIDQGVGDLDPHSTSLRRLEPGNALHSTRVRLHQMPHANQNPGRPYIDPATGLALPRTYRYSAPGIQALFDRPDYIMKTGTGTRDIARNVAANPDGAFVEAVPAGTVYDLRPETAMQHLMPQFHSESLEQTDDWQDRRIDHRYRLNHRVDSGSGARGDRIDRERYPHIPPDTQMPSRLPRRFDPDAPADE